MKKILYLGMATDIMLPLLAEPDFDTLFVINNIDTAFGTWEHQMKHILTILEDDSDKNVMEEYEDELKPQEHYLEHNGMKSKRIHKLSNPCKILSNNSNEIELEDITAGDKIKSWKVLVFKNKEENKVSWRVSFEYENKVRNLIYYSHSFLEEWNPEIKGIKSIFWNGAYSWDYLNLSKSKTLINMIETRSELPLTFYGDHYTHKLFPIHLHYYCGKSRDGNKVCKMVLQNFDDVKYYDQGLKPWWFQNYSCVEDSDDSEYSEHDSSEEESD